MRARASFGTSTRSTTRRIIAAPDSQSSDFYKTFARVAANLAKDEHGSIAGGPGYLFWTAIFMGTGRPGGKWLSRMRRGRRSHTVHGEYSCDFEPDSGQSHETAEPDHFVGAETVIRVFPRISPLYSSV